MTMVKTDGVSGQEPPHHSGYRHQSRSQQQMQVVGHQSPCKTGGLGVDQNNTEAIKKIIPVFIVAEYLAALYSPYDYMM